MKKRKLVQVYRSQIRRNQLNSALKSIDCKINLILDSQSQRIRKNCMYYEIEKIKTSFESILIQLPSLKFVEIASS